MNKRVGFVGSLLLVLYAGCNSNSFPVVGGTPNASESPAPTVTVTITESAVAAAAFKVALPASATAGLPFAVTVTALNPDGTTDTAYNGTVSFISSDPKATLPSNTQLLNGVGNFSMKFGMGGPQTVTAVDTLNNQSIGTSIPSGVIGASISVGIGFACAVSQAGVISCWGDNSSCQLATSASLTGSGDACVGGQCVYATQIAFQGASLPSVMTSVNTTGVGQSGYYTCAVSAAGNVYCWGDDETGELGDGNTNGYTNFPECDGATVANTALVEVPGVSGGVLSGIVAVSTGTDYACAVSTAGNVYCWGTNAYGQLGNGTTSGATTYLTPVEVLAPSGGSGYLSGIVAVHAGHTATCAVNTTGNVYCWGTNTSYQLGTGGTSTGSASYTPAPVGFGSGNLSGIVGITMNQTGTCAINTAGSVFCWGYNGAGVGQVDYTLGLSTSPPPADIPYEISSGSGGFLSGGVMIQSSNRSNAECVITAAGGVQCWGYDNSGAFGTGYATNNGSYPATSTTPLSAIAVGASPGGTLMSGVGAFGVGLSTACAVIPGGGGVFNVACWGASTNGVLGDNQAGSTQVIPALVLSGATGSSNLAL